MAEVDMKTLMSVLSFQDLGNIATTLSPSHFLFLSRAQRLGVLIISTDGWALHIFSGRSLLPRLGVAFINFNLACSCNVIPVSDYTTKFDLAKLLLGIAKWLASNPASNIK